MLMQLAEAVEEDVADASEVVGVDAIVEQDCEDN
jgi:hypothetical protein